MNLSSGVNDCSICTKIWKLCVISVGKRNIAWELTTILAPDFV